MILYVAAYAQDLIPRVTTTEMDPDNGRQQVHLFRDSGSFAYVTAGEASMIANAWIELAEELHEREVDRLQNLPSQDSVSVPTYVTTVETIEGHSMYVTTVENLPTTTGGVAQTLGSV